MTLSNISMLKL